MTPDDDTWEAQRRHQERIARAIRGYRRRRTAARLAVLRRLLSQKGQL